MKILRIFLRMKVLGHFGLFSAGLLAFGEVPDAVPLEIPVTSGNYAVFGLTTALGTEGENALGAGFLQSEIKPVWGLESFHWSDWLTDDWQAFIDARSLAGTEDHQLHLRLRNFTVGSLELEFDRFRTFASGEGASLNPDIWGTGESPIPLLARRHTRVLARLRLTPDSGPRWTLTFLTELLQGQDSSTRWGNHLDTGNVRRGILPAVKVADEQRTVLSVDVEQTTSAGLRAGLGGRFEKRTRDNELRQMLGGQDPARPQSPDTSRTSTQRDGADSDLYASHAFVEKKLSENAFFSASASVLQLEGLFSGNRIFGDNFDAVFNREFGRLQIGDQGFVDLTGTNRLRQWLFSGNALLKPAKNWAFTPLVFCEILQKESQSIFTATEGGRAFGERTITALEVPAEASSDEHSFETGLRLDSRYSGLSSWLFNLRTEFRHGRGEVRELFSQEILPQYRLDPRGFSYEADFQRTFRSAELSAQWFPRRYLHLKPRVYLRNQRNTFGDIQNNPVDGNLTAYPGYLQTVQSLLYGTGLHIALRPSSAIRLMTKADYQDIRRQNSAWSEPSLQATRTRAFLLAQTFSWQITPALLFHGLVQLTDDTTSSPLNDLEGSLEDLVPRARNRYWNAQISLYATLSETTNLNIAYTFFEAGNYYENSAVTVPYDLSLRQNHLSLTLEKQFHKYLRGSVEYIYFDTREFPAEDYLSNTVHLLATRLQLIF